MKRDALAALLLAVALCALTGRELLTLAGGFLVYRDRIAPADAIVVLGGGRKERVVEGVRLFEAGYAGRLVLTGEYRPSKYPERSNWALEARVVALRLGVPRDRILLILDTRTTHDDAVLSRELCREKGFRSLIVISEPYHTRRVFHSFAKVYRGTGIRVMVCPVRDSWYRSDGWWKSSDGIRKTGKEYAKLAYYLLKGRLARDEGRQGYEKVQVQEDRRVHPGSGAGENGQPRVVFGGSASVRIDGKCLLC